MSLWGLSRGGDSLARQKLESALKSCGQRVAPAGAAKRLALARKTNDDDDDAPNNCLKLPAQVKAERGNNSECESEYESENENENKRSATSCIDQLSRIASSRRTSSLTFGSLS